jgi:RNase H-fold protein (predicted Holliday junction resolvase)
LSSIGRQSTCSDKALDVTDLVQCNNQQQADELCVVSSPLLLHMQQQAHSTNINKLRRLLSHTVDMNVMLASLP